MILINFYRMFSTYRARQKYIAVTFLAALFFASVFIFSPVSAASTDLACVKGVVENNGNSIAGAEIQIKFIKDGDYTLVDTVRTDSSGGFRVCNLTPGEYIVVRNGYHLDKVYASGFSTKVTLGPAATKRLTLQLPKVLTVVSPASPGHHTTLSRQVPFAWKALPEAETYTLKIVQKSTNSFVYESAPIRDTVLKVPFSFEPGVEYYWMLTAYDAEGRFVGTIGEFEYFTIENGTEVVTPSPAPATQVNLGIPNILLPRHNEVLTNFPRFARLQWSEVKGAQRYQVAIECDLCGNTKWESKYKYFNVAKPHTISPELAGDNGFRYRVRALASGVGDKKGQRIDGPWSAWRYFSYNTSPEITTAPPVTAPLERPPVDIEDRVEDCLDFKPDNVEIFEEDSGWLMTDGFSRMKVFPNREEAEKALQIVREFNLTSHCFVGRPDPSMEYWLTGNHSPLVQNLSAEEDCIGFNLNNVSIQHQEDHYTLVESLGGGARHLIIKAPTLQEAERQKLIWDHYGFQQICFVGRPDASMEYYKASSGGGIAGPPPGLALPAPVAVPSVVSHPPRPAGPAPEEASVPVVTDRPQTFEQEAKIVTVRGILKFDDGRPMLVNLNGRTIAYILDLSGLSDGFENKGVVVKGSVSTFGRKRLILLNRIDILEANETAANDLHTLYETGATRFSDIDTETSKEYFVPHVKKLNDRGILHGYGDGSLRAANNVTKAEMIKMTILAVHPEKYEELFNNPIIEERGLPWYSLGFRYAQDEGLIPEGDNPNAKATRAEVVSSILLAFGTEVNEVVPDKYSDVSREHPLAAYIQKATDLGFIQGYPDGTFKPDHAINRAEVAKILSLALDQLSTR